ncbi:hypothetical protein JCM18909_2035 [Cutibacterium acnes JCM 18909]|nr:hypothetical protein JCM18909_2035 [Cutibacterium acnes JCM 18909]
MASIPSLLDDEYADTLFTIAYSAPVAGKATGAESSPTPEPPDPPRPLGSGKPGFPPWVVGAPERPAWE